MSSLRDLVCIMVDFNTDLHGLKRINTDLFVLTQYHKIWNNNYIFFKHVFYKYVTHSGFWWGGINICYKYVIPSGFGLNNCGFEHRFLKQPQRCEGITDALLYLLLQHNLRRR